MTTPWQAERDAKAIERITLSIDQHKPDARYAWINVTYEDGKTEPLAADTPAAAIADAIVAALDEVPGVFGPGGRE